MRSLNFRWLGSITKNISPPQVILSEGFNFQGCYAVSNNMVYVDEKEYDARNGLIILSIDQIDSIREEANVIAHEWRHHYQRMNGIKLPKYNFDWINDYENSLNVWKRLPTERDAVFFARKYAEGSQSEYLRSVME